jgi:transcriptional regulator GlxA family with amidase domain
MADQTLAVVFAIFPNVTQLDFTGPHQVLTRLPGARAILASAGGGPIVSDDGLVFAATVPLAQVERCDIVCVPGGPGVNAAMEDATFIAELRRLAAGARWITSVCTGSLVLGAAGLLQGKRAACHWMSRDLLSSLGAIPDPARVVRDGNVVTGGGVTAGIDFALTLAAEIAGETVAKGIQLGIEYAPHPPFDAGRPELAPAGLVARARQSAATLMEQRIAAIRRVTARRGALEIA